MAKRIFINKHAVQGFLIQYKEKHNLNNMVMERLTGISNATISNLCYAKQDAVTTPVYDRLFSFIPLDVLDIPKKGQLSLEEVKRAEFEGFVTRYTEPNTTYDECIQHDMGTMICDIHETTDVIYGQVDLLQEKLDHALYLLMKKQSLWQRIKNKFRKNPWTEKISTNADENLRKK